MLMYCDLWTKWFKIEQQTCLLIGTLRQVENRFKQGLVLGTPQHSQNRRFKPLGHRNQAFDISQTSLLVSLNSQLARATNQRVAARKNVWNVTGLSGFLSMIYEVDLDLQKDPRDALRQRSPPIGMRSHALKSQEYKTILQLALSQNPQNYCQTKCSVWQSSAEQWFGSNMDLQKDS